MRTNRFTQFISTLLIFLFLFSPSCTPTQETLPTAVITPQPSPELTPTSIITLAPPGTLSNPLTLGVVSAGEESVQFAAANNLALQLTSQTGYSFDVKAFSSTVDLLAGIQNVETEIFWLEPVPYLWAEQKGAAAPILLANHYGYYQYGIQFFTHAFAGYNQFVNTQSGLATADAAEALKQFSGKRPCWVSEGSLTGFILPESFLNANQIQTQQAALTQSHSAMIRALYITGICDFGASYVFSGDPRSASNVIQDLTDVNEKIVPIWVSEAIIPNLNLSVHTIIPEELRQEILLSFLVLVKTEEGKQLMIEMNDYTIDDLMIINNSIYDPLRDILQYSSLSLEEMIIQGQP